MKFLVIRLSSIGDIVLATPAIRCLRARYPEAAIHILTKKKMKAVTEANPYIDKFHYFDGDFASMAQDLKKENFDYVIDLHKNLRTFRLRFILKAKWYSYQKLSIQKFLLTKLHIDKMPDIHITTRSLNTLLPLGVKDDGLGLDYFIPEKDKVSLSELPEFLQGGYGAVVIGASYYTKKLPPEKLISLVNKLPNTVMLMGGPEDKLIGDQIIAGTTNKRAWNGCGVFSLNGSADLIRQSDFVISHDTGLQYIACAFQKRVVAIWGGTSPKLAVEPYYGTSQPAPYKNHIVPNLSCQPCSNFGLKACPKKHFNCMRLQDIDSIARDALTGFLAARPEPWQGKLILKSDIIIIEYLSQNSILFWISIALFYPSQFDYMVQFKNYIKSAAIVLLLLALGSMFAKAQNGGIIENFKHFKLMSSTQVEASGAVVSSPEYKKASSWFDAAIPSTVLTALVANNVYPDPHIGMNNMLIPDANDSFSVAYGLDKYSYLPGHKNPWKDPYWYRTDFELPQTKATDRFELVFEGINYRAEVWLNGDLLAV